MLRFWNVQWHGVKEERAARRFGAHASNGRVAALQSLWKQRYTIEDLLARGLK